MFQLCTQYMMHMRVNLRLALGALCVAAALLMLYWGHCTAPRHRPIGSAFEVHNGDWSEVECVINGEYSVRCRRDLLQDEVFVPFSHINKYFEIYGKVSTAADGVEKLEWSHSYGKVYHPKKRYDPHGTFVNFENYNVEVRDRVKCISAMEGVPISTQWEPQGFFYPTQIAQFGLAHYSKHLAEPEPQTRVLEDGEGVLGGWVVSSDASVTRELDATRGSKVMRFFTSKDTMSQVWLELNMTQDFVLSMDLMLKPDSSLTVVLQNKFKKKETIYLHYVTNTQHITSFEEHVYHGLGTEAAWRRLTRDLIIDLQKGWALQDRPKQRSPRNKYILRSIILSGSGALDNVTVSSSAHMEQFYAAARWLVRNQRGARGGWPIRARRRVAPGLGDLQPGWHSAMSQGHAISLLSRAYHRSGDASYLQVAKRALYLLDVPSDAGGVKAMWMDKYVWYEEYPTKPPLFVLNGFIYTLLGLYDLHVIEGENSLSLAKKMFDDGMTSLKTLLPLFDTGSGSFYDLRHFTLGVSPNIARWDYHATHVNQLYLLAGLDDDSVLINTAKRWEGYMQGKRAAHN